MNTSVRTEMAASWRELLAVDPLPALVEGADAALAHFARRDLLDWPGGPVEALWELPEAQKLIGRQQADGSWHYPGKSCDPREDTDYDLLETFRILGRLVEIFGLNCVHPSIHGAAEALFSRQTNEGDIRGILVNQYMPYYHGAILTLLIHAGYADDARLLKGMDWLLSMRQEDGGWIVPAQAIPAREKTRAFWRGPSLPPDRSRPSSHLATDMALRPFASHPGYMSHPDVLTAARLLKGRLFQADHYNDRKGADYWLKFQYPFWWHSLVATLDSLSRLGFDRNDDRIARGIFWFMENQSRDGLWPTGYGSGKEAERARRWTGLAICRVVKRFCDEEKAHVCSR